MLKKFTAVLAALIMLAACTQVLAQNYEATAALDDWDAALSQNPSQTEIETGFEQSENSASVSFASYAPVYITQTMAQTAVAWMVNQVGNAASASTWNGRCLAMVTQAFKEVGISQSGYGTGPLAAQKLAAAGYLHTDSNPPAGTLVMFGACSNTRYDPYGYGHAALSIGNGQIVHAYAGTIRIDNISTVVGHGYPYLGWAVWHSEYGNTMEGVQASAAASQVGEFVERLYTVALNRESDPNGKADWVRGLTAGTLTGAQAAAGFMLSDEFKSRSLSNEDFLTVTYKTFFNRAPDAAGKADWLRALTNGMSREYVTCGFANSDEFAALCSSYGITRGTIYSSQARDKSFNLTSFVNRLYTLLLGRAGDEQGLNDWCGGLLAKTVTPKTVAHGFVFSDEFISKNYSNEAFIDCMYRAFLGREADAGGKADWLRALALGQTREDIFNGFAGSDEFKAIVAGFGL